MRKQTQKALSHTALEKKLQQSDVFYRHLTELTPEAIIIHQKGTIVFANPSAYKLVKAKKKSQLIGASIMQFVHPASKEIVTERVKTMQEKNVTAPTIEEMFVDLKGNTLFVEVTAVPFSFAGEDAILVLVHDITESKHIKQQMQESEQRFHSLLENSSDAIAIINPKGKVLYASQSTKKVLGTDEELAIGKNGFTYVHPKDIPRVMKAVAQLLLKPNNVVTIQVRVRNKRKEWIWLECTGKNLLHDRNIQGIVVNFRNITERKNIEDQQHFLAQASTILSQSIDYETTLKNIADLVVPYLADYCRIVVLDGEQTIKEIAVNHINKRKIALAKKLYKSYAERESNTHGVGKLIQTGKPEMIAEITQEILDSTKDTPEVADYLTLLGLTSYMGVPMKIGNRIVGAITFSSIRKDRLYTENDFYLAQELARRAAYAVENAELYAKEQKAVGLRDEFISLVSHELRTPITSLKLYTQVLKREFDKKSDERFTHHFQKISDQVNKLVFFINDLLNVSRLNYGKLEFSFESCDLNDIVKDTVAVIQETTQRHKITIQGTIKHNIPCDRYRIYQVITNLLNNAIKYSPTSDKIIVTLQNKKKMAVISVKDFGIGINKQEQQHIFSKFYRVSNPEGKTFPGLGMGLYISSEIVKRHGGNISVTSRKRKGSTFTFTLPFRAQ